MKVKRPYAFTLQHSPSGETVVVVTHVPMQVDEEETAFDPATAEILSEIANAAKKLEELRSISMAHIDYEDWVRGSRWLKRLAAISLVAAPTTGGAE